MQKLVRVTCNADVKYDLTIQTVEWNDASWQ